MRKDSVQPRKRKQPAQGRKRKRKVVRSCRTEKGEVVLRKLLHNYCKAYSSLSDPTLAGGHTGARGHEEKVRRVRSRSEQEYQEYNEDQMKVFVKDIPIDFLEEEERYRWPTGAFDLSVVKTEECEVGERCVAPVDVSRGVRSYTCNYEECHNLQFSALHGPNSLREHMKLHH